MQRRSFIEVIFCSFGTFRDSFLGLLGTWWFFIIGCIAIAFTSSKIFHIPLQELNTLDKDIRWFVVVGIVDFFYYLFMVWQTQIIYSNIFFGESRFFSSLKKSLLKSLKTILCCLIFGIIISLIMLLFFLVAAKFPVFKTISFIVAYIIYLASIPFAFTVMMSGMLDDISIWNVIKRSFIIASNNYFRITFSLLYLIITTVLFYFGIILLIGVFRLFGIIFALIGITLYVSYIICYCTETYINLEDRDIRGKEEAETLQIEAIEKMLSQKRNNQIEGMTLLGSNYTDNK